MRGPALGQAGMLIDAAVDGQGVALDRTALAAWDPVALRLPKTYWIVSPKAATRLPKVATFRNWLLSEAAEDMRRPRDRAKTAAMFR